MNPFDVFRRTLTVTRGEAGYYDQITGLRVKGAESNFDILSSVQPTTPEIMELMPEGDRTKESFTLFTITKLQISDIDNETPADFVFIDNEKFIVKKVSKWQNNIIDHYKVVVIKDGRDDT